MSHRGPRDPRIGSAARPSPTTTAEPFGRLVTLSAPVREGMNATATHENHLGALIQNGVAPPGLNGEALERVWARLDRGPTFRGNHILWSLKWAFVAIVLMVSSAVVGAETGVWTWPGVMVRRLTGHTSLPTPSVFRRVRAPGRQVAASRPPATTPVPRPEVPDSPAPAVEASAVARPAPAIGSPRTRRRLPEAAPPKEAQPSPSAGEDTALAEESQLLGRVIGRLRHGGDPSEALAELDRYAARFPTGVLAYEAQRARVDGFLLAGRLAEARATLSTLTLGTGARDRELRLIRAELTAEKGCGAALTDYETVLSEGGSGPLAERALWGKATCHDRLGDPSSARADLSEYLGRFPDGPHAVPARARLRD